jgi:2-oxo-hept-3-ene-1,7-dioate hydratase
MLDRATIQQAARKLDDAERARTQIRQFHLDYPSMTVEDAYAIQQEWVAMKLAAGRTLRGRKIGLTSKAMQSSVGIDEPDYGALLDDMFFPDGFDVPVARFIEPRIEVELAFILGKPLKGAGCTMFDVLDATDWIVPAIEIIDSRMQRVDPATGQTRKVVDTISDNAADAGVVHGGRPIRPGEVDLRWVGALLYRNGVIEETGVAAGVLNHPANGVAWLVNKLAPHGIGLEAGHFVLGGSFTRPVFGHKGDTFHADYGPLGSIAFRFD